MKSPMVEMTQGTLEEDDGKFSAIIKVGPFDSEELAQDVANVFSFKLQDALKEDGLWPRNKETGEKMNN